MLTHYYSVKNPIKTLQKKYKQAIKDKKIDYIISGHTHVPYITNLYYGYTIMNPGSIHKPRDVDAGKTYILGIYKNNKINFKICKVS
jgi:predicted phosphodiesterase